MDTQSEPLSPVEPVRDGLSQVEIDQLAKAVAKKVADRVGLLLFTAAIWAYLLWHHF